MTTATGMTMTMVKVAWSMLAARSRYGVGKGPLLKDASVVGAFDRCVAELR